MVFTIGTLQHVSLVWTICWMMEDVGSNLIQTSLPTSSNICRKIIKTSSFPRRLHQKTMTFKMVDSEDVLTFTKVQPGSFFKALIFLELCHVGRQNTVLWKSHDCLKAPSFVKIFSLKMLSRFLFVVAFILANKLFKFSFVQVQGRDHVQVQGRDHVQVQVHGIYAIFYCIRIIFTKQEKLYASVRSQRLKLYSYAKSHCKTLK